MSKPSFGQCVTGTFDRRTIPRADNEPAWLEQRRPYVGASTVAALFGEHPFITLGQLARERREGTRQLDAPALERGRRLEHPIASWWADVHGATITDAPTLFIANDAVVATLDRLIIGEPAALEVKTTTRPVHGVARYWWWQCQAQLACTGFERIEVAAFGASMTLQSFTVYPDDDAMARLVHAARSFIEAIEAGDDVAEIPAPRPTDAIECDAHLRGLIKAWRFAQHRAEILDDDIKRLRGMVDTTLGVHNSGMVNGAEVVRRFTRTTRNAIDAQRLRDEYPEVAAAVTKPATTSTYVGLR